MAGGDLEGCEGINKTHFNRSNRSQSGKTGPARHISSFTFLIKNCGVIMGDRPSIPKKLGVSPKYVIAAVLLVSAALPAVKPTPVYPSSKF